MNKIETTPEFLKRVEALYAFAKSGHWEQVWLELAGERELTAACRHYAKPSSGWSFLHQAAHGGHEASVRTLIRLGASLSLASKDGDTAADVARKRGHAKLARLLVQAAGSANGLWEPTGEPDLLPSSSAWDESSPQRAWREMRIAYGGGVVVVPVGARYYVDTFGRAVIGWHGTYDPPAGMDGESMISGAGEVNTPKA